MFLLATLTSENLSYMVQNDFQFWPSDFLKKTGLKHTKDLGDQIFGLVACGSANTLSFSSICIMITHSLRKR